MPFDPTQSFEEVAPVTAPKFNPDQPFEPVNEGEGWKSLYSGLDQAPINPIHAEALDYLGRKIGDDTETRAATINQSYVQSKMPGWQLDVMQQKWPSVRDAYAKEAGYTQGEPITDSSLYTKIGKTIEESDAKNAIIGKISPYSQNPQDRLAYETMNLEQVSLWHELNAPIPLVDLAAKMAKAPALPDIPGLGIGNPAIAAGVWNTIVSVLPSFTSPLAIGTFGIAGEAKAGNVLAQKALTGITGLFAGLMGKAAIEKAPEVMKVVKDPKSTLQEKVEAVGSEVADTLMSLAAALHTVHAVVPKVLPKIEGKTPGEAAQVLRQEANATPEPAARDAMLSTAEKLDEIPSPPKLEEAVQSPAEETPAKTETKITPEEVSKEFSIKNESVNKELQTMGEEPLTKGEVRTDKEAMATAVETLKADPEAGMKLVDELMAEPRPATHNEAVLLQHEWVRLNLERTTLEKAFDKAKGEGGVGLEEISQKITKAREDIANTAEVLRETGAEQGRAFRARQMMLREDYSLGSMERQFSESRGGESLTDEHAAVVKDLNRRIEESDLKVADTQKALEELKAKFSERLAEEESTRPLRKGKPPTRIMARFSEEADRARERIKQRLTEGRVSSGIDPALLADHVIVGADYILRGARDLATWSEKMAKEFGDQIKPYLPDLFAKAQEKVKEGRRLEAYKTRTQKSTQDFQRRIKEGDFTPKEKKAAMELDEAARRAQAENKKVKEEFQTVKERNQYEKSSVPQKIKTQALATYDAARLLMTTGEFSFILRQGKVGALSHPILAAKALPDTFRALMADPTEAHAINLKVLNHPDAAAAKAAKLHLVEEGTSLNKQEEFLMSKLVETNPVLVNTVGRFNRAAVVFLNKLRFDMWQSMRESSGGLGPAEQKQLATFVNEATGRGSLGLLEPAAVPLARVMFAPRYLASRLQLAVGHSLWGGTWETRRIIAKEYAKTLIGLGAYYSALYMAFQAMGAKPEITSDPRSTEFGKVKLGNTRLDPLAGVSQVVVFGARTGLAATNSLGLTNTPELVNSKGKEKRISGPNVPFGGEKWSDVSARFARSKLHPVPGAIINLFDGTDLAGNKVDAASQAANMVAPLTYVDIYQAMEEQDLPEGASLGLLAMLGEGLQTYDQKHPKKPAPLVRE